MGKGYLKKRLNARAQQGLRRLHAAPRRRAFGRLRIAAGEQHLKLMRLKRSRGIISWSARPEPKSSRRQSLLAEPKTLTVVDQNLQGFGASVPKDEHRAAHGIAGKLLPAHPAQSINASPKIRRLYGHPNPHVRRELNHAASPLSRSARTSAATSETLAPRT